MQRNMGMLVRRSPTKPAPTLATKKTESGAALARHGGGRVGSWSQGPRAAPNARLEVCNGQVRDLEHLEPLRVASGRERRAGNEQEAVRLTKLIPGPTLRTLHTTNAATSWNESKMK